MHSRKVSREDSYKMDSAGSSPMYSPGQSSRVSSPGNSRKQIGELKLSFSASSRHSFRQMVSARKASSKLYAFSIASFFEEGDHTETDIDVLHYKLEEKIQRIDNERKTTSSNHKKKKRSLLQRILTLSYFSEPTVLSVANIVAKAKTGDLILMKKFSSYSFGSLDLTVANGINSCTTKGFVSTVQNMQMWNQVGIVVELYDYDDSAAASAVGGNSPSPLGGMSPHSSGKSGKHREMKYMLFADVTGIKLVDLAQVVTAHLVSESPVALRQLVVNETERGNKIRESIQQLGLVILRQYSGVWYYDSHQEVHRQQGPAGGEGAGGEAPDSAPVPVAASELVESGKNPELDVDDLDADHDAVAAEDCAGSSGATDDQVLRDIITVVINRTKLTLYTPSAEDIADSRRAFFALDANGDGTLEMKEVVMLLTGSGASSGTDRSAQEAFVKKYLSAMDKNHDGVISVEEYVQAYKTLPVSTPNPNLDVRAIINAEFVLCVYFAVGLIRAEYVADDISYLPHSFASASTHASSSMNELLPSHIKARAATVKPLDMGEEMLAGHRDFTRYINNRLRYFMMVNSKLKREVLVKLFD